MKQHLKETLQIPSKRKLCQGDVFNYVLCPTCLLIDASIHIKDQRDFFKLRNFNQDFKHFLSIGKSSRISTNLFHQCHLTMQFWFWSFSNSCHRFKKSYFFWKVIYLVEIFQRRLVSRGNFGYLCFGEFDHTWSFWDYTCH